MYGARLGQAQGGGLEQILAGVLAIPALQPFEAQVVTAVNPYLPTVASGLAAGWWAQHKTTIALTVGGVVASYFLLKKMR